MNDSEYIYIYCTFKLWWGTLRVRLCPALRLAGWAPLPSSLWMPLCSPPGSLRLRLPLLVVVPLALPGPLSLRFRLAVAFKLAVAGCSESY